jgi:acetyl esterase/lipase
MKILSTLVLLALTSGVALGDTPSARIEPAIGTKAVLEDRYPERRVVFPGGVAGLPDLVYSTVAGFRPLTLDLYLPPQQVNGGAPVIIYVHGGGWMSGHTRHSGAFENWPGVLAALAGRFGIDKRHIGIWGGSAGGQLAALAGTSCGVSALEPPPLADAKAPLESDCVQAVVTWYGVFDFTPLTKSGSVPPPVARYLGCEAGACADDKVALASAIRHIDRNDPPFLLIHGALDKTVAPSQSEKFHAALQASAVKSQLILLPDVDHSFVGNTPELTRDASLRALHATIDFFDATLRATH